MTAGATQSLPGTWTAGGNLLTARFTLAGAGSQTAGLSFGGFTGPWMSIHGQAVNVTEEYNGTSWAAANNLIAARWSLAGLGTQTAGLSAGGYYQAVMANTEEYDGSSWAAGGALSTARYNLGGCGTQTAGLSFGGYNGSVLNNTEEYDKF